MTESEDKPPTLASLRARRGKTHPGKRTSAPSPGQGSSSQNGLFSILDEVAPTLDIELTQSQPKPAPNSIVQTERRIWSVRALVINIGQHIETTYTDIWVEGEISNCRSAPSGHIYFTLKDGEAQLPVVLFRRQAILLRFRPADGLAVLVRGHLSVYTSRGQLQLIAETLEPRGVGTLQLGSSTLRTNVLCPPSQSASASSRLSLAR
jgi:exodeoxyribonuclease VII large subunit